MTDRAMTRRAFVRRASGLVLATAGGLVAAGAGARGAGAEGEALHWCGHNFGPLHDRIFSRGVAPEWQHLVVLRESNFDAFAVNASSGAAGLCQYLPWVWEWITEIGLASGTPYNPYDALDAMDNCLREGMYWMWSETAPW